MPSARRLLALCALACAALALVAGGAVAATPEEQIFADFVNNRGAIVGDYSPTDLRAALQEVAGDPLYADFAAAVDAKLDSAILGRSSDEGAGELIGGSEPEESALPVPRAPDESGDPPWPFLALTVLAGALVVTGAGSSIYRRARR